LTHFKDLKSRGAFGNSSIKSDIEYLLKELKLTKNISTGTLSFSKLVIFVSKIMFAVYVSKD
jgi:hypothetical protein